MKIYGDIEALKSSIEKKYGQKIGEVERATDKKIEGMRKEADEKIALKKAHISTLTESEVRKEYSKILSEEELKARNEFEKKRDSMIKKIFGDAKKGAKKKAHNKKYISHLKANMPKGKGFSVVADSKAAYKTVSDNIKVDKSIAGVKFVSEDLSYDFTLDGAIDAKREQLRHAIIKALFE